MKQQGTTFQQTSPPMDTLPPLGQGLPLHHSLPQIQQEPSPSLNSIPGRARQHLAPLKGAEVAPSTSAAAGARGRGRDSAFDSPPPSPPRLGGSISPVPSRSVPKMGSMDDTYCDRIRSTSSFGWYDDVSAFESVDVPQSKPFCQIEDWRNLETWDGGRETRETQEEVADVEFVVPNARVTSTKTFRHGNQQPEPYAVSIGSTRVRRVSPFAVYAEYQVLMSTKDESYKSWKRFSDFKLLAEYAKISDLRETVTAWTHIQQTQRWFRCLEANYLKTKCRLLEKFLAQLLFEVHTPSLLMTFVGAQQPGLRRR